MNDLERAIIEKKRETFSLFIKEQHRLPKSKRSQSLLEEAKTKVEVLNRWLKD